MASRNSLSKSLMGVRRSETGSGNPKAAGSSYALTSSRLGASTTHRGKGGAGGQGAGSIDTAGRPQLVDATGRNITPKPLLPSKEAPDKKAGPNVLAAAAAAIKNQRSLIASGASHTSDGSDNDRLSSGFSQSGLSDGDEESVDAEDHVSDGGGDNEHSDEDEGPNLKALHSSGPPIYQDADAVLIQLEAKPMYTQGHLAPVSLLSSTLFPYGFPNGLPAIPSDGTLTVSPPLPATAVGAGSSTKLADGVLDSLVTVLLSETETSIVFNLPSTRALADSVESRDVLAANERYDALKATIARSGAELYPSRGVSTLNAPAKTKEVLATPVPVDSIEVQASSWEIDDTVAALKQNVTSALAESAHKDAAGLTASIVTDAAAAAHAAGIATASVLEDHVNTLVNVSLNNPGCLLDVEGSVRIVPGAPQSAVVAPTKPQGKAGAGVSLTASMASMARQDPKVAANSATGVFSSGASGNSNLSNSHTSAAGGTNDKNWGAESYKSENSSNMTGSRDNINLSKKQAVDPNAGAHDLGTMDIGTVKQAEAILKSRSLLDSLALMERAVQQNLYHEAHRKYRAGAGTDLIEHLLAAGRSGGHLAAAAVMESAVADGAAAGLGGASPLRSSSPAPGQRVKRRGGPNAQEDSEEEDEGEEGDEMPASRGRSKTEDSATRGRNGSGAFGAAAAPGLQKLWSYGCPEVAGLTVSCMAWNKANLDLLAVGYGSLDYDDANDAAKAAVAAQAQAKAAVGATASGAASKGGLIALWSISNPEHPQAILKTPEDIGVTALDFSTANPSLLAAGLGDGTICVYDVRSILLGEIDGTPGLTSDKLQPGAHTEAVWQVKWITKVDIGAEVLVSVSTDGRVTQWDCKKGLAPTLLMILKRARALGGQAGASAPAPPPPRPSTTAPTAPNSELGNSAAIAANSPLGAEVLGLAAGTPIGDGILARTASGLTFDFSPADTSQYFIGTEDGLLARCSTSYAEQYLEVIQAHAGPLNRLRLSPFMPQALLTCSADWTVKLWNLESGLSVTGSGSTGGGNCISYHVDEVKDAVCDISWSPTIATVFASVTRDGHIQVWEAAYLSPLIDQVVTLDSEVWKAHLAAQAAERAAAAAAAAAEARKKRRLELGYDEEDENDEGRAGTAQIADPKVGTSHSERGDTRSGIRDGTEEEPSVEVEAVAPRKRLTCVLFADTNTQILVTGDTTGRVDVYRIVGIDDVMDVNAGLADPNGGGVDAMDEAQQAHVETPTKPRSGQGTGLVVGSEAYEAQVTALQGVLASMNVA